MSTPTTRKKPGPKPPPTTFLLEELVADANSRAIANTNTLRCFATSETLVFDRKDATFKDRLTDFLMRAAKAGAIRASDVKAWMEFLYDDGWGRVRDTEKSTKRKKTRSGRPPQVYLWAAYDF